MLNLELNLRGFFSVRESQLKHILSILIVSLFAIIIFTVPYFFEIKLSPLLLFSSIVMVSIYVILSFEIIHRTSIAIFGALILVIASLLVGIIIPKDTLHFVIEVIDFNTIGLLLGMMIIVVSIITANLNLLLKREDNL